MINKTTFLSQSFGCVIIKLQEEGVKVGRRNIEAQLKKKYKDHYSYHSTYFEVIVVRKEYRFTMTINLNCEKQFNYFTSNTSKRFGSPQEAERYMQQNDSYRKEGE